MSRNARLGAWVGVSVLTTSKTCESKFTDTTNSRTTEGFGSPWDLRGRAKTRKHPGSLWMPGLRDTSCQGRRQNQRTENDMLGSRHGGLRNRVTSVLAS